MHLNRLSSCESFLRCNTVNKYLQEGVNQAEESTGICRQHIFCSISQQTLKITLKTNRAFRFVSTGFHSREAISDSEHLPRCSLDFWLCCTAASLLPSISRKFQQIVSLEASSEFEDFRTKFRFTPGQNLTFPQFCMKGLDLTAKVI